MVNIDDADAFKKMIRVEGEEYREHKSRDALGDCSFEAFHEAWKSTSSMVRNADPPVCMTVNGGTAIYGLEGYNRYAVMSNGAIRFIADMSTEYYIKKARECGFDII